MALKEHWWKSLTHQPDICIASLLSICVFIYHLASTLAIYGCANLFFFGIYAFYHKQKTKEVQLEGKTLGQVGGSGGKRRGKTRTTPSVHACMCARICGLATWVS